MLGPRFGWFALAAALVTTPAAAGDGSTPASITVDLEALQGDVSEVRFVEGASTPTPVLSLPATHAVNPNGVTIIRGGNHHIEKGTGTSVSFKRAVAGENGAVFVTYVHHTGLSIPRIRKVAADNATAFDVSFTGSPLAGVAPDGDGGLFVAHQFDSTANGGHQFVQSRIVFRRHSATGAVLWEAETPNWPYPADGASPVEGPASRWVTTIASPGFVTVGYAHADGTLPGIERRQAADGALVFRTHALKKPSTATRGLPGALGNAPLTGRVHALAAAPDGSVLAVVDGHVVRLDAAGKQTHVFPCANGSARGATIQCTKPQGGGGIRTDSYGVADGALSLLHTTQTQFPDGWVMGVGIDVGGGKRMFSGRSAADKVALALVAADGHLLATKLANAQTAGFPSLGAGGGKWMLYVSGDPKWTRVHGTYAGGNNPGSNAPGTQAPAAVHRGQAGR